MPPPAGIDSEGGEAGTSLRGRGPDGKRVPARTGVPGKDRRPGQGPACLLWAGLRAPPTPRSAQLRPHHRQGAGAEVTDTLVPLRTVFAAAGTRRWERRFGNGRYFLQKSLPGPGRGCLACSDSSLLCCGSEGAQGREGEGEVPAILKLGEAGLRVVLPRTQHPAPLLGSVPVLQMKKQNKVS